MSSETRAERSRQDLHLELLRAGIVDLRVRQPDPPEEHPDDDAAGSGVPSPTGPRPSRHRAAEAVPDGPPDAEDRGDGSSA